MFQEFLTSHAKHVANKEEAALSKSVQQGCYVALNFQQEMANNGYEQSVGMMNQTFRGWKQKVVLVSSPFSSHPSSERFSGTHAHNRRSHNGHRSVWSSRAMVLSSAGPTLRSQLSSARHDSCFHLFLSQTHATSPPLKHRSLRQCFSHPRVQRKTGERAVQSLCFSRLHSTL